MRGIVRAGGTSEGATPALPYKEILNLVLQHQPSGTRQRLAQVLGKNRSFISQITNPNYQTPIPASHVEPILEVCRFSAEERAQFLAAYESAHPGRLRRDTQGRRVRHLTLDVPDFGDDLLNREYDRLLEDTARKLKKLTELSTSRNRLSVPSPALDVRPQAQIAD